MVHAGAVGAGPGQIYGGCDIRSGRSEDDSSAASLGFVPYVGPGLNLFWSFGGRRLFNNYTNNVIPIQMETGVLGLPSTLPFK